MILLTSEDYVKTNSNLNDNFWGKMLLPAIREAQDIYLQQIIGTCLYYKLMDLVDSGDIALVDNAPYKDLLDDKIQLFLVYQTIVCAIPASNPKLSNFGQSISNDEHLVGLSKNDIELIGNYYQDKADFYCKRIQNWLKSNREQFPELDCTCEGDIKPNLNSAAGSSVWLGGIRGRKLF